MFKFCRLHHPQGLGYGNRLRWRIPHSLLYTPRLPVLFRSLLIAITIALWACRLTSFVPSFLSFLLFNSSSFHSLFLPFVLFLFHLSSFLSPFLPAPPPVFFLSAVFFSSIFFSCLPTLVSFSFFLSFSHSLIFFVLFPSVPSFSHFFFFLSSFFHFCPY